MIPYADVESDALDRFSSPNALRNRSQIVRDPHGSYRSGKLAPDRPLGVITRRGLKRGLLLPSSCPGCPPLAYRLDLPHLNTPSDQQFQRIAAASSIPNNRSPRTRTELLRHNKIHTFENWSLILWLDCRHTTSTYSILFNVPIRLCEF